MSAASQASASSNERQVLERALAELQATASLFGTACIHDARVRMRYANDIAQTSKELREAVSAGSMSAQDAADRASALRNEIMGLARRRGSPVARAYANQLKSQGRSLPELVEKYAQRLYGQPFASLSAGRQAGVYQQIIRSAGRPDPAVMQLAERVGTAGRRVLLVSLAVAVYEITKSDNKPREVIRQGALIGAGTAGGWAAGAAVLATGVCAATAPVCVTVAALVGSLIAAYGLDTGFGELYPKASR